MKWLLLLPLLLAGCPSSCQQRRTTQLNQGEQTEVKVERAAIERVQDNTKKKTNKVVRDKRPDGTVWRETVEVDELSNQLVINRKLLAKAEGRSNNWDKSKEDVRTVPWWDYVLRWLWAPTLLGLCWIVWKWKVKY
jgi:hypothetical protein